MMKERRYGGYTPGKSSAELGTPVGLRNPSPGRPFRRCCDTYNDLEHLRECHLRDSRTRSKLPTEGNQHQFRERDDDEMRCMHCGGYPFDLIHWCNG